MTGEGLPRVLRLRRSGDFRSTQRGGRCVKARHLVGCFRPNGEAHPRFGVSVSRKVGNAVVRNRVKRWLREAIRRERAELTGLDMVFIARPSAATAGYQALRDEVSHVFGCVRGAAR